MTETSKDLGKSHKAYITNGQTLAVQSFVIAVFRKCVFITQQ